MIRIDKTHAGGLRAPVAAISSHPREPPRVAWCRRPQLQRDARHVSIHAARNVARTREKEQVKHGLLENGRLDAREGSHE